MNEVASAQLAFPVPIGIELVDEDGALLAAVPADIALTIPVDVEPSHTARTGDGILEDAGEEGPPLPGHVLRHADVYRPQRAGGLRRVRREHQPAVSVAAGRLSQPWKGDRVPASQASRSPGVPRSQSGRISRGAG